MKKPGPAFNLFTFPPFHLLDLSTLSAHRPRTRVHRTLLTEAASVTLACVRRFQFRLLSRRNEVRMLLKVLDDLFGDDLSLESAQCRLDRFVRVNCNKSHFSHHLLSAGSLAYSHESRQPIGQTIIKLFLGSKIKSNGSA